MDDRVCKQVLEWVFGSTESQSLSWELPSTAVPHHELSISSAVVGLPKIDCSSVTLELVPESERTVEIPISMLRKLTNLQERDDIVIDQLMEIQRLKKELRDARRRVDADTE